LFHAKLWFDLACRYPVALGRERGFNFLIRPAMTGTHRGASGFDLAPQVVVISAGLAALLDVAAHQFAHDLGRGPIFAGYFGHEVGA
jgi:hypothetical protein